MTTTQIHAKLLSHTGLYWVNSALTSAQMFLLLPLFARALTSTEYGVLELSLAVIALLQVLMVVGFDSAIIKTYYRDAGSDQVRDRLIAMATAAVAGIGVVAIVFTWFFRSRLAYLVFREMGREEELLLVAAASASSGLLNLAYAILRARQQPGLLIGTTAVRFAALAICEVVALYPLALGVRGALAGFLVADLLAVVPLTGAWLARRQHLGWWSSKASAALLDFGLPALASTIFFWMLGSADRLILRWFVDFGEIGAYGVGSRIASLLYAGLAGPFAMAWTPVMFGVARQDNARETYAQVLTSLTVVLCFAGLLLSAFSPEIVQLVAGVQYAGASRVVPLVVLARMFDGLNFAVVTGVQLTNRYRVYPLLVLIAAVSSVGMKLLLVPWLGIMGAAIGGAAASILLVAMAYRLAQSAYPIPYGLGWIKSIGCAVVLYLAVLVVPAEPSIGWVVAKLVGVVLGYATMLHLAGVISILGVLTFARQSRLMVLQMVAPHELDYLDARMEENQSQQAKR